MREPFRAPLVYEKNVALNARHDPVGPPSRIQIEMRRYSMPAAKYEQGLLSIRQQIIRARENIEVRASNRHVFIECGRRNRFCIGIDRKAQPSPRNPLRNRFSKN